MASCHLIEEYRFSFKVAFSCNHNKKICVSSSNGHSSFIASIKTWLVPLSVIVTPSFLISLSSCVPTAFFWTSNFFLKQKKNVFSIEFCWVTNEVYRLSFFHNFLFITYKGCHHFLLIFHTFCVFLCLQYQKILRVCYSVEQCFSDHLYFLFSKKLNLKISISLANETTFKNLHDMVNIFHCQ